MSVSYFLNYMGPITMDWFRERGLTHKVERVVESELIRDTLRNSPKFNYPDIEVGDNYEIEEVHTHYAAGRIDIRDSSKQGYDGWDEYSVAPMHGADWGLLSEWLWDLETTEVWDYEMLISTFESEVLNGRKIRWWKDDDEDKKT